MSLAPSDHQQGRPEPSPALPEVAVNLTPQEHEFVAEAARWAPSIHNSQPWRLHRIANGLAVSEDVTRSLPIVDPFGRDRTISCAAAIFNAWTALRCLGYDVQAELLPSSSSQEQDLLATLTVVGPSPAAETEAQLHRMIPLRRTHRRVYRSNVVAEEDLLHLREAAAEEGARLSVADPSHRRQLARLLHHAVTAQFQNPELRHEVEQWIRRGTEPEAAVDGIPSIALGTAPFPVDSLVHASTTEIPRPEEIESELARSTVLVLSTREDTKLDWVVAGLALERLLLTATGLGLVATFAEQPLQSPTLRPQVAEALRIWGYPQVLLRIGRPLVEVPRTPRRPVESLFS
jgi:nitroreductase